MGIFCGPAAFQKKIYHTALGPSLLPNMLDREYQVPKQEANQPANFQQPAVASPSTTSSKLFAVQGTLTHKHHLCHHRHAATSALYKALLLILAWPKQIDNTRS